MLPSSPFPVVIFLWQFLIVGFSSSSALSSLLLSWSSAFDLTAVTADAAAAFWIFSLIFL